MKIVTVPLRNINVSLHMGDLNALGDGVFHG
jgi:hypothetical protein